MKRLAPVFLLLFAACNGAQERDNTQFVNVFTGTGEHGHTYPGATRPFAMVQLSPDTHLDGWDASSGYHWGDSVIYAFSHTHLSGTGIGDLGDVALMPYCGWDTQQRQGAAFSHSDEVATPGFYSVRFRDSGIGVELTSTERVGMHRYTFPADSLRSVVLDLSHILQPCWGHRVVSNTITYVGEGTVNGTLHTRGWAWDHRTSYHIVISESASNITLFEDGKFKATLDGTMHSTITGPPEMTLTTDKPLKVVFDFSAGAEPLLIKVALSSVDTEGAEKNMAAELPGWDFDAVKQQSHRIWKEKLAAVEVSTADTTVLQNFYTALYHTMVAPILWQDADGRYRGMDKQTHTAGAGYTNYTALSLWDTFRAWFPLMTVVDPGMATDLGEVLMQGYREGGVLPKWPLASNYTGCMVAYPAVSVLADLQAKGLLKTGVAEAADAARRSSVWRADLAAKFTGTRELDIVTGHTRLRERFGFVPADSIAESVSWGIEMAYDDWCVAQLCRAAGEAAGYDDYMERAAAWKRYFDPETKMMRGVMADGTLRTPFNPYYSAHMSSDYTEGTAFQWSFFVPHDMDGFIAAHGGAEPFEKALDGLFSASSQVDGQTASGDITGLVGQYAHGNEPSHHIAYLYNRTASPHKGQAVLDTLLRTFYTPTPEGIIGNEDMGQMSAWYVLGALGLYQVCPGDPIWSIGRPLVDSARIRVRNGFFNIEVHNNAPQNRYVAAVKLDGQPVEGLSIPQSAIRAGGKLEITMSDKPGA